MGRRGAFIALIELPKWNGIQNMEGYFEKKKYFPLEIFFAQKNSSIHAFSTDFRIKWHVIA